MVILYAPFQFDSEARSGTEIEAHPIIEITDSTDRLG